MIVAVALFAIVMVVVVGALVSLIDANRKARTQKTAVNNIHSTIESLSREMREGTDYTLLTPTMIAFKSRDEKSIIYALSNDNRIIRSVDGGLFQPLTAEDVFIRNLSFEIIEDGTNNIQPKVLLTADGVAGQTDPRTASTFNVQTLISQRIKFVAGPGSLLPCEYDIALTLDTSGSICGAAGPTNTGNSQCPPPTELQLMQSAVNNFIDAFDDGQGSTQFSLVEFTTSANLRVPLTTNYGQVQTAVNGLLSNHRTNMAGGILLSTRELLTNGRNGIKKFILLITDGSPTAPTDANGGPLYGVDYDPNTYEQKSDVAAQVAQLADQARAQGIEIITVIVGLNNEFLRDPDNGARLTSRDFMEQHVADYPPAPGTVRFAEVSGFSGLEQVLESFSCENLSPSVDVKVEPF